MARRTSRTNAVLDLGNSPARVALARLVGEVRDERSKEGRAAHRWARRNRHLIGASAVGVTLATALGVAIANTHGRAKLFVIALAVVGGVLNAGIVALKTPQYSEAITVEWLGLRSLSRRLETIINITLPSMGDGDVQALSSTTRLMSSIGSRG